MGARVSEHFKFRVSGSRNNRKRTALNSTRSYFTEHVFMTYAGTQMVLMRSYVIYLLLTLKPAGTTTLTYRLGEIRHFVVSCRTKLILVITQYLQSLYATFSRRDRQNKILRDGDNI